MYNVDPAGIWAHKKSENFINFAHFLNYNRYLVYVGRANWKRVKMTYFNIINVAFKKREMTQRQL